MSHSSPYAAESNGVNLLDSMSFASLLPVLFMVLLGAAYAWVSAPKVQAVYFIVAWTVAAISILRIQQLIEHYSAGRYHYQPGGCALLLLTVVMMPWLWLFALDHIFHLLVAYHLVTNSRASWVFSFTLGTTLFCLLLVSPMIESWYEILRGAFAFDGSRIKTFRPSFWAQFVLFGLFSGILLLPMTMASNHPTYILDKDDTSYILTGFFSTYIALIWLVMQLERIREAQVSLHTSPRAPIDRALLQRSSPLSNMLKPSHKSRPLSPISRKPRTHIDQVAALAPPPQSSQEASSGQG